VRPGDENNRVYAPTGPEIDRPSNVEVPALDVDEVVLPVSVPPIEEIDAETTLPA